MGMQIERKPEIKDSGKGRLRFGKSQSLAADCQIHRQTAGSSDPAGANCGVLILARVLALILMGATALAGCGHIQVRVEVASPGVKATEMATPTAPAPSPTPTKPAESVRLTYDPAEHSQPALSPDGQMVVYISDWGDQPDVVSLPVGGGQPLNLTQTLAAREDTPVFSPDGSAIAFASDRDGDWSIYLLDANGSNVRPALSGYEGTDEVHPAFTPDGLGLVFSSNRADGNWDIYTATIGSDAWTRLTTQPAADRFPTLSADGRTIAFRSERDGNSEIYLMDADGSNLRRVTDAPAFDGYPSIIPDGSGVIFVSNRSGQWNTFVTSLAGGEVIALEQRAGWQMDTPRLSSDGRWLVYAGGRTGGTFDIYMREFVSPLR